MKLSRVAQWLHHSRSGSPTPPMDTQVVQDAMKETNEPPDSRPDDIIAAFDRERERVQELNRQHTDLVRNSRADDRPVRVERRRRPR